MHRAPINSTGALPMRSTAMPVNGRLISVATVPSAVQMPTIVSDPLILCR